MIQNTAKSVVLIYDLMLFIIEKDINLKNTNTIFRRKYYKKLSVIALLIAVLLNGNSFADGWIQPKGHGILITSFETRIFRGLNSLNEYTDDVKYTQSVVNLYSEYGLTNRLTIVGKIIAVDSMLMKDKYFLGKVEKQSFGIDTLEVKTKIGIIKSNRYIAMSIVAGLGTPSLYHYNEASQFAIRKYKQLSGIEIGLNISKNDILMLSAYYHWNINYWYNELRMEIAYGHKFFDNVLVMVRFQKFKNYTTNKQKTTIANVQTQTSIFDFYFSSGFAKFTLSVAVPINNNLTFEFGAYTSVKSKIIDTEYLGLKMRGFYASIWFSF